MKLWVLCLMVFCLACSKSETDKSAATAPSAPAQPTAPADDKPEELEAKAIAALKAEPVAKVKAYVVYHQHYLDVLKQYGTRSKEYQAKEKSGQYQGTTGAARNILQLSSMGKEVKDAMDKAQAESRLSDKELSALGELMASAQMQEHMQKEVAVVSSAKTAAQIAKYEQIIQSAPAEMREQMKKQLEEMKQAQVAVQDAANMKDMRAKYGDAAVDAMLAAVPELNAQLKQYSAAAN
jgi:hypothetical protein